jgi:hypothetical protein
VVVPLLLEPQAAGAMDRTAKAATMAKRRPQMTILDLPILAGLILGYFIASLS